MPADGLVRFVTRAGWAGCLGSIALAWSAPGLARLPAFQWSPWLVGLLVLGIPHGASDHRVGAELSRRGGQVAGPGFYAAYLSAVALVIACWFTSPLVASAGFLAVAAVHFGQGDVYWSRLSGLAARSSSLGYRGSLLVARSTLPIALPLLAFPGEFSGEADALARRLFGHSGWTVPPDVIAWGFAVVAAVVALHLAWAAWIGIEGSVEDRRAAAVDAGETVLLASTFWFVPPVLALGVYFNAWHSLRHVARLMEVDWATRRLVEAGRPVSAFAEFARRAWPMTAGATVLMVGLGLAVGKGLTKVADLGMLAVVLLSALTLPHVLVVAWMDLRQGVWSPTASSIIPEEVEHVRAQ